MDENSMTKKTFATLCAVMIFAVCAVALVANESEATTPSSITTTVHYKGPNAQSFTSATSTCYDMYQAINAVDGSLGFTINVSSDNQSWTKYDSGYYNPNRDYGKIDSITVGGTTYTTGQFGIFVYNTTVGSTVYEWREANSAIGWYHPYADYGATYPCGNVTHATPDSPGVLTPISDNYRFACADVAIVIGANATAPTTNQIPAPALPQTIPKVVNNQYMYKFNLSSPIASDMNFFLEFVKVLKTDGSGTQWRLLTKGTLSNGITVVGWGSNAYEALDNAFQLLGVRDGQNRYYDLHTVSDPSYTYYTHYSWMDKILNNGTVKISNPDQTTTYKYWASYVKNDQGTFDYCAYTLGYYSTITGAPVDCLAEFNLTYESSTF